MKADQEIEAQALTTDEGSVTAGYVAPYVISFLKFYCTEQAAGTAADAFSGGKGGD